MRSPEEIAKEILSEHLLYKPTYKRLVEKIAQAIREERDPLAKLFKEHELKVKKLNEEYGDE